MVDRAVTICVRTAIRILRLLPHQLLYFLVVSLVRLAVLLLPRYRKIAEQNLLIAFPEETQAWRDEVFQRSLRAFGRMISDAVRLPDLTEKWVRANITIPNEEEYQKLHESSETGILIVTGHLGSFELLGRGVALYGYPLSFVVRDFKNLHLNRWWKSVRELGGNRMISRKGAYRNMLGELKRGRDVAILFDQNVRRSHAIFVDFFSRPAATTRAVALAAIQSGAPIIVVSTKYRDGDGYTMVWKHCLVDDLRNSNISREEKYRQITSRVSKDYEEMVRQYPEGWFWMHRRWKTTPSSEDERVYAF